MALTILFADICDRSEISKTRRRANLLKRKVLSAGNIVQGKQGPGDRGEYTIELESKVLEDVTITEKAPTRAFSWLKAPTKAFTFKTLLRHYAKQALTPRSLNVKLGPRRNYHEGRAAIRHYANQPAHPL